MSKTAQHGVGALGAILVMAYFKTLDSTIVQLGPEFVTPENFGAWKVGVYGLGFFVLWGMFAMFGDDESKGEENERGQ